MAGGVRGRRHSLRLKLSPVFTSSGRYSGAILGSPCAKIKPEHLAIASVVCTVKGDRIKEADRRRTVVMERGRGLEGCDGDGDLAWGVWSVVGGGLRDSYGCMDLWAQRRNVWISVSELEGGGPGQFRLR